MPFGAPDCSNVLKQQQAYGLHDMAELAARLDSPVKWERRGYVIWMQTFESGLKAVDLWGTGAGRAQYLSTDLPFHGSTCLHLLTGNAVGNTAGGTYDMPLPVIGLWGYQTWVSFDSNLDTISFWVRCYNGTQQARGIVTYDLPTQEIRIYVDGVGWTVIDDNVDLFDSLDHYHVFKLVANYDTLEYVRLIVNETTYDLEGYDLWREPSPVSPQLWIQFSIDTIAAAPAEANIDNIIFTINEPS